MCIEDQNKMMLKAMFEINHSQDFVSNDDPKIKSSRNEELILSVEEHRRENGLTPDSIILDQIVNKTKPFTRTIFCIV